MDWDALMRGVFANLPMAPGGQVLVNLGLIHREQEVIPYWDCWLDWMRTQGWRRFAWYVWDQGPGLPGDWNGRLAPSFEFVFHFNRQARQANKIMPCKFAGQETHLRKAGSSTAMRKKDGTIGGWTAAGTPTQDTKIPDSVIRVMRHKGKIGQDIDHRNIDDLTAIIDRNHQQRIADLPVVNQIIMREMSEFLIWYYSQPLLPATRAGATPDPDTQREIVAVKDFLISNLPYLLKVAMRHGTDFAGHFEVVNQLAAMKEAADKTRFQVAA